MFLALRAKEITHALSFASVMEQPINALFDSYFARSRFLLSLPLPPSLFFCPRTAKTRSGDEIIENRYSQSWLASCISIYGIYNWRQPKHNFLLMKNPQWSRKIENVGNSWMIYMFILIWYCSYTINRNSFNEMLLKNYNYIKWNNNNHIWNWNEHIFIIFIYH